MRGGIFYGYLARQRRQPSVRELPRSGLEKRFAPRFGRKHRVPRALPGPQRPEAEGCGRRGQHPLASRLPGRAGGKRTVHRFRLRRGCGDPAGADGRNALVRHLHGRAARTLRRGQAQFARRLPAWEASDRSASVRTAFDGSGDQRRGERHLLPRGKTARSGDRPAFPERRRNGEYHARRLRRRGQDDHPRRGARAGDRRAAGLPLLAGRAHLRSRQRQDRHLRSISAREHGLYGTERPHRRLDARLRLRGGGRQGHPFRRKFRALFDGSPLPK